MKVLKEVKSYRVAEIEPIELTLLSQQEYISNEDNIPHRHDFWWLRSKGYYQGTVKYVLNDGSLSYCSVHYGYEAVRPALKFIAQNLRVEERFKFGRRSWTVIADGIALCDTIFRRMEFRKDWQSPNANDYTYSDIKQYLDQQLERMKNVVA